MSFKRQLEFALKDYRDESVHSILEACSDRVWDLECLLKDVLEVFQGYRAESDVEARIVEALGLDESV